MMVFFFYAPMEKYQFLPCFSVPAPVTIPYRIKIDIQELNNINSTNFTIEVLQFSSDGGLSYVKDTSFVFDKTKMFFSLYEWNPWENINTVKNLKLLISRVSGNQRIGDVFSEVVITQKLDKDNCPTTGTHNILKKKLTGLSTSAEFDLSFDKDAAFYIYLARTDLFDINSSFKIEMKTSGLPSETLLIGLAIGGGVLLIIIIILVTIACIRKRRSAMYVEVRK